MLEIKEFFIKNRIYIFLIFVIIIFIFVKLSVKKKQPINKINEDSLNIEEINIPINKVIEDDFDGEIIDKDFQTNEDKIITEEDFKNFLPPKYNIEDYIPYEEKNFKILSFNDNLMTVKLKNGNKEEVENELKDWIYYDTGNDPEKIEIVWK